jgi:hypothetical protein
MNSAQRVLVAFCQMYVTAGADCPLLVRHGERDGDKKDKAEDHRHDN